MYVLNSVNIEYLSKLKLKNLLNQFILPFKYLLISYNVLGIFLGVGIQTDKTDKILCEIVVRPLERIQTKRMYDVSKRQFSF